MHKVNRLQDQKWAPTSTNVNKQIPDNKKAGSAFRHRPLFYDTMTPELTDLKRMKLHFHRDHY